MAAFVGHPAATQHAPVVLLQPAGASPAPVQLDRTRPASGSSLPAAAICAGAAAALVEARKRRSARGGARLNAKGGGTAVVEGATSRSNGVSLPDEVRQPVADGTVLAAATEDADAAALAPAGGEEQGGDEDMSARIRYVAPLLPLGVFPLMQAKESAQRNSDLQASTSPAGSNEYVKNGWTPSLDSPCYEALYRYFPRAMPATPVFERSRLFMSKLGLDPSNTLFGSSLCPDEINNKPGGVLDQTNRYWGEQFPLGGLGGVPLVGKTGWGAFSHHCPDNGNIFVLYGPHVGVSEQGEVGKIMRVGQDAPTSACGAFVGAYKQTADWKGGEEEITGLDMQQQFIRNQLGPMRPTVASAQNPMAELSRKAFSIVDKQLLSIVDLECCNKLVLLGGIQVNTPDGLPDHFEPLRFEVHEKGKPVKSLMKAFNPALDPNALL